MLRPRTLFDKIWQKHEILADETGETLLYIDRELLHEGSQHSFEDLRREGRKVQNPRSVFSFADHYVPTVNRDDGIPDPEIRRMVETLERNAKDNGVTLFDIKDIRQGILHIVSPEQGITQPGLVIAGADSHTSTHGAFGCLAFGIGASEATHIMATETLWQRKPKVMRITVDGDLPFGVTAKDIILAIIAKIGAGGGARHVIEYAGSTIFGLSMEERMTVCNMSIEAGARAGMVAPDEKTYAYLEGRPFAPKGEAWEKALCYWKTLPSDADAPFDREEHVEACEIAPMVTWGTSPETALPITAHVPDPQAQLDGGHRKDMERALAYMDLKPGTPLTAIVIDRVFIGSCTNSRIEDIRNAAEVVRGRKTVVPAWVVPGSGLVKRQAEAEGLHRIFLEAGFEWREPGCSMCTALNGDMLQPGERCASTSNRNFQGRQGRGGRTHLVSPAMAAAAAVTGKLTDVRQLGARA